MTIRHMQIFRAVCEQKNVTRAAELLGMTQPAVSIAIRELESYYNAKLFDRIGRRIYLTEAGQALLGYADAILSQFDEATQVLRSGTSFMRCRLGVNVSVGETILPDILDCLERRIPGIKVEIYIGNTRNIEHRLSANEIDVAIADCIAESSDRQIEDFYVGEVSVVASPEMAEKIYCSLNERGEGHGSLNERGEGHCSLNERGEGHGSLNERDEVHGSLNEYDEGHGSLNERDEVHGSLNEYDEGHSSLNDNVEVRGSLNERITLTVDELARQRLLLREEGSGSRISLEAIFRACGCAVEPVTVSTSDLCLLNLARRGFGVTILPRELVASDLESGRLRELHLVDAQIKRRYFLAYNRRRSFKGVIADAVDVLRGGLD